MINSKLIQYEKKSIPCSEIRQVRYGILQMYINGIKANRIYEIGLTTNNFKPIRITFQSSRIFFKNEKLENTYNDIIECLWNQVTKRLVTEAIENLEKGKTFSMEKIEVHPKGIQMQVRSWLFKKNIYFVEWKDVRKYSQDGLLCIYSEQNKKAKINLNYQKDWNTPVLSSLLDYLWENGRAYALSEDRF
ncbi:MAG TPA: hypothetical protein PKK42_08845 [Leptospiraceae bacterium]|nr:hypothetical protein [Leptospiraceae bacterium]